MYQDRQALILKIVVEQYIRTHRPVASASVVKEFPAPISSATIRNDMAAFEREGYLIKPHTSAGRIPTDKGCRQFVDSLTDSELAHTQIRSLKRLLASSSNMERGVAEAVKFLASLTGQVAISVMPSYYSSLLLHRLEVVGKDFLTVILICASGHVKKSTMRNPGLSGEEIAKEVERINGELSGEILSELAAKISSLSASAPKEKEFLERLSKSVSMCDAKGKVYIYGVELAYRQMQRDLLMPLLDALEERMALIRLMTSISRKGIGIAIGSEIQSVFLPHISVLSARYGAADWQALIGLIGSTYMNYPPVISSLRDVAECLSDFAFQQFPSISVNRSFNGE